MQAFVANVAACKEMRQLLARATKLTNRIGQAKPPLKLFSSFLLLSSPELSDAKVYEPQIRALLTTEPSTSSSSLRSSLEWSDTTIYEPYMRDLLGTAPGACILGFGGLRLPPP